MSTEKKRVKELNQSIQNQFVDMCGGSKNSRALSNLLKSGRCRVNAQDSKGNTPLTTAVLRDNGLIRDFLLAYEGINPNAPDKFNWDKHNYGVDKCVQFKEFKQVHPPLPNNKCLTDRLQQEKNNKPKYYDFHGSQNPCVDYPSQRLFYNFTKRSTVPNFHNLHNIDPVYRMKHSR